MGNNIDKQVKQVLRLILKDIKVELGDEFDQNFERQAFFSQAWERRRSPTRPADISWWTAAAFAGASKAKPQTTA